ncbi:MAG: trypsin-like peptidase domain-containing protein [Candidatus Promineifilaceae bacterium]|nr:trypsin-like peptidase domain-containing protein [Candidatus Promineifilaceae bacterium]
MKERGIVLLLGAGCLLLLLALVSVVAAAVYFIPAPFFDRSVEVQPPPQEEVVAEEEVVVEPDIEAGEIRATQVAIPTLAPPARAPEGDLEASEAVAPALLDSTLLQRLYDELTPGVVSVRVISDQAITGEGSGSGFVIDEAGYIVTNNHVVADAADVTVVFSDGFEMLAELVGNDPDSDLAVLKVEELPDGVRPLPLADSDTVDEGEWVVAIGNPFSFEASMSTGIVSAIGRTIPSGFTPFSIPQAIQTDAAINPGNSGGPLLNLDGQVIGVNAQIRTASGVRANSGVGFAIPSNVVRLVAPVLIEQGRYQWPYLGVSASPFNVTQLALQMANDFPTQEGAYIHVVQPGGPADQAGLQGSVSQETALGRVVPVGGDLVVGFNGENVTNFSDLLTFVAFSQPGDEVVLTVWRDDEFIDLTVELAARPQDFTDFGE